jgi:hypothetical protein
LNISVFCSVAKRRCKYNGYLEWKLLGIILVHTRDYNVDSPCSEFAGDGHKASTVQDLAIRPLYWIILHTLILLNVQHVLVYRFDAAKSALFYIWSTHRAACSP